MTSNLKANFDDEARIGLERLRKETERDSEGPFDVVHYFLMCLVDGDHLKMPDDMTDAEFSQWLLAEFFVFELDKLHKGCEQEGVELTPGSLYVSEDEEAGE